MSFSQVEDKVQVTCPFCKESEQFYHGPRAMVWLSRHIQENHPEQSE